MSGSHGRGETGRAEAAPAAQAPAATAAPRPDGGGSGPRARRIGLYGGSFDPVHRAHVALAEAALHALALDEVRFVPAGQPWQKARAPADARHRLAMLRLATAHEPRFAVDPIETLREGPSYTIDTVRALQAREPGARWFLLVGADQHAGLHTWRDWPELLARVTPAVAARPGSDAAAVDPAVARRGFETVPLPPADVSSTEVRRRAAAGLPLEPLVPAAVARYIESNGLYRPAPGS